MNYISNKDIEYLYKSVLSLENIEECKAFFEDICTINELNSISQRMTVARLLSSGMTFNEIAEKTGASSATISRVNKALNYGEGYKTVLKKEQAK
ncbi:MAG: TrpR-like protein YerC/YecD [Clostridia bacterium]|nr:TrpR-like protein YerC/YecD [Clostridia bacterium]